MKHRPIRWLILLVLTLCTVQPAWSYYNPTTGKWLSRDPIGERSSDRTTDETTKFNAAEEGNLYSFVLNRPILLVDLLGREPVNPSATTSPITAPPKFVTRAAKTVRAQHNWGIYQVLIVFDVTISDSSNKPIPGVGVAEAIVYVDRHNLIGVAPRTGSATTDKKGMVSDIYYASFCGKGGYVIVKQTITVSGLNAILYTTVKAPGTWSGNLRSVFH